MKEWLVVKEAAERLLIPAGFGLQTEERDADAFGSFSAIYARSNQQVRVMWDGRDAWAFLEEWRSEEERWRQLGMPIAEDLPWELKKSARIGAGSPPRSRFDRMTTYRT